MPQLREAFDGRVIAPDDSGYDAARAVFYGGYDRRPAVIVRPLNADEVARVVSLAAETGVELAVRSGGHSVAGHSSVDGGIVLDLSYLRAIDIDAPGRTAWAEPGLTAGEYTEAVGRHGLVTGFGDTGSVGIGGITLGGGVGFLARKYGLTIDDLLAADIVTADGRLLRVDAEHYPDLFWAIRGGGGNFGVATRFQFRLHEVPSVVGGVLMLPATADVIESFIALADAAPDELSTIANVMPAPPMPFVPEEFHGQLIIMAFICYAGDTAAGERAVAQFRALAKPLADMVEPGPYTRMYLPEEEGYHPIAASRTMYVDGVDERSATSIVEHLGSSDAMMRVTQLRVLGGAVGRVPNDATAYAHRDSRIMANVAALCQNTGEVAERMRWVDSLATSIQRGDTGAYVGFLGDEAPERVRDAYPGATWERLTAVKAKYDPTNLFRLNQNVAPAPA
ncbi:MAG TPA: FAD-binding oxidoreductase [Micromonosporaceae bacterium]|nr:FAD-binding oxidoreductase [Micromonosporaceae bacterium]